MFALDFFYDIIRRLLHDSFRRQLIKKCAKIIGPVEIQSMRWFFFLASFLSLELWYHIAGSSDSALIFVASDVKRSLSSTRLNLDLFS